MGRQREGEAKREATADPKANRKGRVTGPGQCIDPSLR